MGRCAAWLVVVALGLSGSAGAQCRADVDCKGERICRNGECVDPPVTPPEAHVDEAQPSGAGRFPRVAAIVGLSWLGVDLVASVGAEVGFQAGISDASRRSAAESATNLVLSAISFGAAGLMWASIGSAKERTGVADVAGLRWAAVGLFAVSAFTTIAPLAVAHLSNGKDAQNEAAVASMVGITVLTQVVGLALLAVDGLITAGRADAAPAPKASSFEWSPSFGVARGALTLGVAGAF